MADKKDKSGGGDGYSVMWEAIGFIIVLLMVTQVLTKLGSDTPLGNTRPANYSSGEVEESTFNPVNLLPHDKLALGKKIVSIGDIKVRNAPAGEIIGEQNSYAFGKIKEGPVDLRQIVWWRVDFEKAPDGWVDASNIKAGILWAQFALIFSLIFNWLKPFAVLLSLVALILLVWVSIKKRDLDKLKKKREEFKKEQKSEKEFEASGGKITPADLPVANLPIGDIETSPKTENVNVKRWQKVKNLMNSHSSNDWRQAIIEADIILEEMLIKMGYRGEGIGEMLKSVERSDFITLNNAWEAHKVRNMIAHKGGSYVLSRDEAEKTIENFETVFKEFYYV